MVYNNYYDYGFLILSAILLFYMMTFIQPEIEKLEKENKVKIDPYLPFCISSPLLSIKTGL